MNFKPIGILILLSWVTLIPAAAKAQDTATNGSTATANAPLSDDDKLAWNTLLLIADDMQNGATDDVKTNACSEFLDKSATFATAHPENLKVWVFRAQAALTLDDFEHGIEAGSKLKALGALKNDDMDMIKLMAKLNRKGWLDFENKEQAVEQGMVAYRQGKASYDGSDITQDFSEAMKMFSKGAELGNSDCMYYIGSMYLNGQGVAPDAGKAILWLTKAASAGCKQHLNTLGQLILCENPQEAIKWETIGANNGDTDCMQSLAGMYCGQENCANGVALPYDYNKGIYWYNQCLANGIDVSSAMHWAETKYRR